MTRKKIFWIGGIVILVVIAAVLFSMNGNNEEAVTVQTAQVDEQKIVETVTATGIIQPETQVKISADVAAKIIKLGVKEGDWVEKGQLLAQLDREKFLAVVESAEANLRSMEATANLVKENMNKTEKDYLRVKDLYEKQLESQASMDQAYAAYKVEIARHQSNLEQVDQAKASLKQAKDDLSKTTIYAPMAGTVSQLNKEVGEIALGSQFQEDVIMVISNLTGMEALVDVDENDIVSVHLADSASIEVDALPDHVFRGAVSEIASSAKVNATGTADQKTEFEVKVRLKNPGEQLRPGMTATADIITETRDNVLAIPIQCVTLRTPEQLKASGSQKTSEDSLAGSEYVPDKDGFVPIVFVINDDQVKAVQVETGIQSETHIEIRTGLDKGNEIVTGNFRAISETLQNDTRIKVENENQSPLVKK